MEPRGLQELAKVAILIAFICCDATNLFHAQTATITLGTRRIIDRRHGHQILHGRPGSTSNESRTSLWDRQHPLIGQRETTIRHNLEEVIADRFNVIESRVDSTSNLHCGNVILMAGLGWGERPNRGEIHMKAMEDCLGFGCLLK